jgi:hypothetical protein
MRAVAERSAPAMGREARSPQRDRKRELEMAGQSRTRAPAVFAVRDLPI